MNIQEVLEAVAVPIWNRMVGLLTKIYRFTPEHQPRVVRTDQFFDPKTGEQVIVLQYRVKLANQTSLITKSELDKQRMIQNQKSQQRSK